MMGIGAEDDRLAFSGPRSLEIGNSILCARGVVPSNTNANTKNVIASLLR